MDTLTPEELQQFTPFESLSRAERDRIAQALEIKTAKRKQVLLKVGSDEPGILLLLEGAVGLEANDGRKTVIQAKTAAARNPIARLRPSMYNVVALTPIRYVLVDPRAVSPTDKRSEPLKVDIEASPVFAAGEHQPATEEESPTGGIYFDIHDDLKNDVLVLPTLPDVALRIRSIVDSDNASADLVAQAVVSDPAIAAKLLRAANSPLYRGQNNFTSVPQAIVRLGMQATKQMVTSFALRELFSSDHPMLNERLNTLWKHSIDVAATCFVLARLNRGFDPERALLTGLVHDVGVVSIVCYAENYPRALTSREQLETIIRELRGDITAMILQKWNFAPPVIEAARLAENWTNDSGPALSYADLVALSQLHLLHDDPYHPDLPALSDVPAYTKLENQELTEDGRLRILAEATAQIEEAKQLLLL
ncbi:MAG: HDOD domain-containing protein [Pseudomonadota bacterium]|nr:HDOD domain-containing protein [Pseudomonadota bacterium]